MNAWRGLALVVSLPMIAACGDNPASASPPAVAAALEVPAGADGGVAPTTSFAAGLPVRDDRQPLKISDEVPPTSETAEPEPVS